MKKPRERDANQPQPRGTDGREQGFASERPTRTLEGEDAEKPANKFCWGFLLGRRLNGLLENTTILR